MNIQVQQIDECINIAGVECGKVKSLNSIICPAIQFCFHVTYRPRNLRLLDFDRKAVFIFGPHFLALSRVPFAPPSLTGIFLLLATTPSLALLLQESPPRLCFYLPLTPPPTAPFLPVPMSRYPDLYLLLVLLPSPLAILLSRFRHAHGMMSAARLLKTDAR